MALPNIRSLLPRLLRHSVSPRRQHPFIRHPKFPHCSYSTMSDLFVHLTAPNGCKIKQPRGLFIDNEFVASLSGDTITSINPRLAILRLCLPQRRPGR